MTVDKMILYGLAAIYASLEKSEPLFVLKQWETDAKLAFPQVPTAAREKVIEVSDDDVNDVYKAYPTRDKQNGNRPLSKGAKSKTLIRAILERGLVTKDVLIKIIHQELKYNEDTGKWLKDFNTFLNNLPDLEVEEKEPQKEEYRLLW